ncbi:MAG: nicotinate (nicotinamide) nucleotide adenylyltransferase [Chlorobium phaeobacteroides]|uniref:Probable nicotinate-nucleotide adenylyltransferase n=1 Tax=Chlorobium phaeobacteroides (strain BS1) TaxID=331678 RepID=NADD_CHLPB|nr:RecName: Full=Probable nicotinate-nucleotide adenylyltransferase; AltName: Full=Deamido-NAD(+) diphosphorylase; AltName: Full=Deamido-NAD(+) pyrophosphorylase; AltName: Full=Nicotinate mononucleotide adenylyltransferase; Short=NaMN adenylyltransferase [Chlorobium phaeobacteroides BS1]MBL6956522.1 nicotinate (nicotinamide) nucleotide adenylyltransferase [Chlorobium phaeobacteroides]
MRLAVFGGSFDPPHNGHLALCLYARELLQVDRLVISASNNPLKDAPQAADRDRVKMAELLAETINRTGAFAEVSSWEANRGHPVYTIDLMEYLEEIYSTSDLTLLIGEDNFLNFRQWKSWEELIRRYSIIVFGRKADDGASDDSAISERLHDQSFRHIDLNLPLSSTEIRKRLASGDDCSAEIPSPIWQYIVENQLYQ